MTYPKSDTLPRGPKLIHKCQRDPVRSWHDVLYVPYVLFG